MVSTVSMKNPKQPDRLDFLEDPSTGLAEVGSD
jgi:hypothetical protein